MKTQIRNFLTCTAILIALGTPALAQVPEDTGLYPKREQEVYVPSGKTRKVYWLIGAWGDCTPWKVSDVEIKTTQEPKNGTVQFEPAEGIATFKQDGPLAKCHGRKMRGLNINYKSSDKFVGTDEFELLVMWPNSRATEMHFTVNVK
jgi:hypothetical protein